MQTSSSLENDLPRLQELYDAGRFVAAWNCAQAHVPFTEWRNPEACTFAGRLLGNVEAPRLAHLMHTRAWRAARSNATAAYFRASTIAMRLGPLRALRFLEKLPPFPAAEPKIRASLLCLQFRLLASYRDQARVEKLWKEALAIAPDDPWIWVERASSLTDFDAYSEALNAAQQALAMKPKYRPAIQTLASLLALNGRDDEAIALLRSALEWMESASTAAQLASLLSEHDRHEEALLEWRRYRELAVAIEPAHLEWWHARMSDAHYELGDLKEAGEHARLAKNGFHEQIAERILHPPAEARVVKLRVPFVRQHDMTCAPATLSALLGYWKAPVDHLEIAREICYDGTQPFVEREWAEKRGFVAREFTVTWDAARALLDRGIPFALGTMETRSAHLQGVMGYDGIRGTLILRDPYLKHPGEVIAEKWLANYASSGPRGIVVLPASEAARLEGLDLPDAGLYDHLHAFAGGLHVHDRERAVTALAALEQAAPDHRIVLDARRDLAWYDVNQPRALAATEALLAKFPGNNRLRWARYQALDGLSRQDDRKAQLQELARGKESEPHFWREYGANLQRDARQLPEARRWLLRALHYQARDAETLHTTAGILWDERRRAEALALYRLAAMLREKVEHFQRSWFIAARHLRSEGEVISVMQERAHREEKRSSLPCRTLYWALSSTGRDHEALAALDRAIAARPEDGSLLCFGADAFARYGNGARASELLAEAETRSARSEWLRAAARIADYRPNPPEALRYYRLLAKEDPLDLGIHETVARLIAETEGSSPALEYLREQSVKFPHHVGFREAFIRRSRAQGAECCETPLRELIAIAPENVWAIRELALVLGELNRSEEALEWCERAVALRPKDESSRGIRAGILLRLGRKGDAAEEARAALRLSIDYTSGFATLLDASETFAEKQTALAFILAELKQQTVFGDGLLEYLRHAFSVLEPAELIENLRSAREARPDLWHAWTALITMLCDMQRAAEALPIAEEAVERFPLIPRLLADLARVRRERREFPQEVESLQRAVAINPSWGYASRLLSNALQRVERYEEAQSALEEAIAAAPLDPHNYHMLAQFLWRRSRSPRAIELLSQAIRLEPDLVEAWSMLRNILPEDKTVAIELAESLTGTRGGECGPWLRLAEMLPVTALERRLALVDRALGLDPRNSEAHDLRACLQADAGRYDDALASCNPPIYGGNVPRELRGRAAWIIARRGNLRGGLDALRELVKSEPDYYWAWERIAIWSDDLGDHKSEQDAAEKMARLNPRSAIPLGYLAEAMLKLKNRDGAVEVLRRAFALDPTYGFAGFTIFQEEMGQKKFSEAAVTLSRLQQHLPGADTTAAAVHLATGKKEKETALAEFEKLLWSPENEAQALRSAATHLATAGYSLDGEKLIWSHREDPRINPAAGSVLVRGFAKRKAWENAPKVIKLSGQSPFERSAIKTLAVVCGEYSQKAILEKLMKKHGGWMREDVDAWGNVGYALVNCASKQEALQWFGAWREREGLQSWMLHNVALTLENLGREDEAMEANRLALSLPWDHVSGYHLTRLSLLEALRGDMAAPAARLAQVDPQRLEARPKAEFAMVKVMVDLAGADPQRRKQTIENERNRFYWNHPMVHSEPKLNRLLKRFEQRLGAICGTRPKRPVKANQSSRTTTQESPTRYVGVIAMVLIAISRCASMSTRPSPPPTPEQMREWQNSFHSEKVKSGRTPYEDVLRMREQIKLEETLRKDPGLKLEVEPPLKKSTEPSVSY